jgi:phenylalanyl-tRNA synthetase alpha chain
MEQLLQQIDSYKKEIEAFNGADAKEVEEFRIKWLGTKGLVKPLWVK